MGYYKQLHIDCPEGECLVNEWETCWQQPDNPSYTGVDENEKTNNANTTNYIRTSDNRNVRNKRNNSGGGIK